MLLSPAAMWISTSFPGSQVDSTLILQIKDLYLIRLLKKFTRLSEESESIIGFKYAIILLTAKEKPVPAITPFPSLNGYLLPEP